MERDRSGRFVSNESLPRTWAQPTSNPGSEPRGAGRYLAGPRSGVSMASCAMSFIAGAASGAAAMFLLDPQSGERRRQAALDAASHALESATDAVHHGYDATTHALGDAWDSASNRASDAGSSACASLPSARSARKSGRRFLRRAGNLGSNFGSSARNTAGGWLDSARGMLPRAPHLERHSEYAMNPVGVSVTAVSALALGVGAMWLLDPSRGRGRRAWIGQKMTRIFNETGEFARTTGRHLRNKARGYYHETARAASSAAESLSDTAIAERVRSALGGLNPLGSSIGVTCSSGCVTLTGRCVSDDVDRVLSTTRDIYGVNQVRNQLEIGDRYPSTSPTSL